MGFVIESVLECDQKLLERHRPDQEAASSISRAGMRSALKRVARPKSFTLIFATRPGEVMTRDAAVSAPCTTCAPTHCGAIVPNF
jgi:hypothetical protein